MQLCVYPSLKTTKAALSFSERRLRNSGFRSMASDSLDVDHLRSRGLDIAADGQRHGDEARATLGPLAKVLGIQLC